MRDLESNDSKHKPGSHSGHLPGQQVYTNGSVDHLVNSSDLVSTLIYSTNNFSPIARFMASTYLK